jgi:hypothetical protein
MPYASDRSARLYYDDSCGPCRFMARATEAVSRQRVTATPLAAPTADGELQHLSSEQRYRFAHLATGGALRTGEALLAPLVGLTLGSTWERVVRRVPPLDRALRWGYVHLGQYRHAHGHAASALG